MVNEVKCFHFNGHWKIEYVSRNHALLLGKNYISLSQLYLPIITHKQRNGLGTKIAIETAVLLLIQYSFL